MVQQNTDWLKLNDGEELEGTEAFRGREGRGAERETYYVIGAERWQNKQTETGIVHQQNRRDTVVQSREK